MHVTVLHIFPRAEQEPKTPGEEMYMKENNINKEINTEPHRHKEGREGTVKETGLHKKKGCEKRAQREPDTEQ